MTRCLDEATLQTYFDGELSGEMMERATLHLASCSTCAAAAREVEEEINLMMTALAPEFEASVPTERLRQHIDEAVLDLRVGAASSPERTGFGAFIASLLSFGTQRTLGYASLAMVLAFAAIFGFVKLRTTTPTPPVTIAEMNPAKNADEQVAVVSPGVDPTLVSAPVKVKNTDTNRRSRVITKPAPRFEAVKSEAVPTSTPVKLLPGERAYLQTIARLDTTIKANQKSMRPFLQVEYERNLAVVDRAIAATRNAAKSNPTDPDAADFMFAAYQSKVDLLNTIADARLGGGRSH